MSDLGGVKSALTRDFCIAFILSRAKGFSLLKKVLRLGLRTQANQDKSISGT